MIKSLEQINTDLQNLHIMVNDFFQGLEAAQDWNDLFPDWFDDVYGDTKLRGMFEDVYTSYKSELDVNNRNQIISYFTDGNRVLQLCSNEPGLNIEESSRMYPPIGTQSEELIFLIEDLFDDLYHSYLEYWKFEESTGTSVSDYIDQFIEHNEIEICPFCGIEGYTRNDGEERLALDHWLCKSKFPFSAVNFENLVPIGHRCNSKKSALNVLIDNNEDRNRIIATYPYLNHEGVNVTFRFIADPLTPDGHNAANWELVISPRAGTPNDLFESWMGIFNIQERLESDLKNRVFRRWQKLYKAWVHESKKTHANNLGEFKTMLEKFKATFPLYDRDGSIVFRPFIDYLLDGASDQYLTVLFENFQK